MESYDIIANQPVVIDNGSGVIKAGFAGDQIPKYCFPNYVGRPKHVRVMAGALEGDIFIGPKAEEHRGLLSIRYPMEHGIVKDWNDMERIWQYVYSKDQLQTFSEEHPVLLTEAPLNPRKNRERAAEVFFETFNVPALFISMQAVLSLYATGRTTGVVLDSGDGVTHAVPIYEGFAMPHSIMRIDIAGRDVSRFLRLYLRKEGYDFHSSSEFEIVKTIKERACCAKERTVEIEVCSAMSRQGQVSQQSVVIEVHQGQEAIIETQTEQELHPRRCPLHPECQEGESQQWAMPAESPEPAQNHILGWDRSSCPAKRPEEGIRRLSSPHSVHTSPPLCPQVNLEQFTELPFTEGTWRLGDPVKGSAP
uniref:Actin related protein 1A n=1 Tax=Sarcophilus harrisii TaxID=9305 RepID=A0A7N4NIA9_SARHA